MNFDRKLCSVHLVIGAGPAGLTAAYSLAKEGVTAFVCESHAIVGGISRTESHNGYHFDLGGHRFFTRVEEVKALWEELLQDDFLLRPRLSRIFYKGRFIDYPLNAANALRGLGMVESTRVLLSYGWQKLQPRGSERTFSQWMTNRFGRRLFEIFFKTYTEKVWGISTDDLSADWAAQRIKNLSLREAVVNAIWPRPQPVTSLIEEFHYPRRGPGMMWSAAAARIEALGGSIRTSTEVVRLHCKGDRIEAATIKTESGMRRISVASVISSMPLPELVDCLDLELPHDVSKAARSLRYRDFLTVILVLDNADLFPDNWIYIHDPQVKVGRIQNFKNWSAEMVPDGCTTSLGLEYFCWAGDELWNQTDEALVELAAQELQTIGLSKGSRVITGCVLRVPKAYPVYDSSYREALGIIRRYLERFTNLQTVGRAGLHRYNNQDHAMLTGLYAARNVLDGGTRDVWSVNTEAAYLEDGGSRETVFTRGRNPNRASAKPMTAQSTCNR